MVLDPVDMEIDAMELQRITSTDLTLGTCMDIGDLTVVNVAAVNSNTVAATLNALADDQTLTFMTTASTFNTLTAQGDHGVVLQVDLTTDTETVYSALQIPQATSCSQQL